MTAVAITQIVHTAAFGRRPVTPKTPSRHRIARPGPRLEEGRHLSGTCTSDGVKDVADGDHARQKHCVADEACLYLLAGGSGSSAFTGAGSELEHERIAAETAEVGGAGAGFGVGGGFADEFAVGGWAVGLGGGAGWDGGVNGAVVVGGDLGQGVGRVGGPGSHEQQAGGVGVGDGVAAGVAVGFLAGGEGGVDG